VRIPNLGYLDVQNTPQGTIILVETGSGSPTGPAARCLDLWCLSSW